MPQDRVTARDRYVKEAVDKIMDGIKSEVSRNRFPLESLKEWLDSVRAKHEENTANAWDAGFDFCTGET